MAADDEIPDKEWAQKDILDPLTAPEPSQETGPGSSFARPPSYSVAVRTKEKPRSQDDGSSRNSHSNRHRQDRHSHPGNSYNYPIRPSSASPARSSFPSSNPFSSSYRPGEILSDRSSQAGSTNSPRSPPADRRHSGSGAAYTHSSSRSSDSRYPPQTRRHYRDSALEGLRSNSFASDRGKGHRRNESLNARYPGDMSHRPLDMIKKDTREADRGPHLRHRHHKSITDTIDNLDNTVGGVYHHDGPYDATLASRNRNKKYSPVEAVKDSNMEALKATPREYIQDSLVKHVPLQGTATIPPGMADMSGNILDYEEGADLMREPDAGGGAYRRWDGIVYHPDDLKGKGEPSYTFERDLKQEKARLRRQGAVNGDGRLEYEMLPQTRTDGSGHVRQRSLSQSSPGTPSGMSTGNGLGRSNTTGKRLSDGLKRRFGSMRRKKEAEHA